MITINYGKDWVHTAYETLKASDISEYLKPGMSVSIKPNLVVSKPPSEGATTHPEVVEGIIKFLQEYGISKIQIIESSSVGQSTANAYRVCGYNILEKKYGVPLIDLKQGPASSLRHPGLDMEVQIAKAALETDFLINVPVLKAHCQTRLTCCMKNLKGCIPESEMKRFHSLGLHRPIAALNALLPVHYHLVDGICGDLSFEEGGTPVEANRIIAGRDPVLIDSYCAELIGYTPKEIGYLLYAKENQLGEFFSESTKIQELNTENKPTRQQTSARLSERYRSGYSSIEEDSACSVCYAALIYALHRSGSSHNKEFCIGQGFKNKTGGRAGLNSTGIGNCTRAFATHIAGCPPKATDIMEILKN